MTWIKCGDKLPPDRVPGGKPVVCIYKSKYYDNHCIITYSEGIIKAQIERKEDPNNEWALYTYDLWSTCKQWKG